MKEIHIPRYVDSQIQVFFWELDEAIVFCAVLGGGIVLGSYYTILSMVAGVYAVKAFKRFKNNALEGVLLHMFYWAGLMQLNKVYKDSGIRDFFL